MGKKKNPTATVTVTISTTQRNCEILDWLARQGPYGKNRADVAERIVSERLRDFLPDEKFNPEASG